MIAKILSMSTNSEGGEHIVDCKVDPGGGNIKTIPLFATPGIDARPRPGDYAALVSHPGDSHASVVATADPDNECVAGDGEARLYARDGSGATIAWVYVKSDGSIRVENDNGFFELEPGGRVVINNNLTVDP